MAEARACKECGKMFIPKGREKYCSDTHYRPCPVCGTPVVAKYLSDPPCKCSNCRGKKVMQPMSKAKSIFKIPEPNNMPKVPNFNDLAKVQPKFTTFKDPVIDKYIEADIKATAEAIVTAAKVNANATSIDISKVVDPETFCEIYDDKVMRYIGPTLDGLNKFKNNHDYKIALTRKDNYYILTSCHDLTEGCETNCFYIASSQLSVSTRFVVVEG